MMSLVDALWARGSQDRSRVALVGPSETWTYWTLVRRSSTIAADLAARPGLVAIAMGNQPELVAALFGAWAAGRTAMMLDPRWTDVELAEATEDQLVGSVVVGDTTPQETAEFLAAVAPIVRVDTSVAAGQLIAPQIDRAAPALILFTSGSSGRAKAVAHSHAGLAVATERLIRHRKRLARKVTPRRAVRILGRFPELPRRAWHARGRHGWMTPMSFGTISGMSILSQAIASGGRLVTVWPFSPTTTWAMVRQAEPSVLAVKPSMLTALLDSRNPGDRHSLLVVGVGAAPVSAELRARAEAQLGCPVVVGYGSTEMGGGVFATNPWDRHRGDGDVGTALDGCDWRIIDSDGREVSPGTVGELAHRSPGLMLGYDGPWGAPLDSEGWYRTGDLAVADRSGRVRIVGRRDGMINRKGFGIYPAEIERVVERHPEVSECAVVWRTEPSDSGVMELFVVPVPDAQVDSTSLASWCASHLAAHKLPDRYEIRTSLPRTDAGTIRRAELR